MALGGAVLRISQTAIRAIQLLASILVLAVFSYFLVVLKDHKLPIATWIRAVEGMSGAAVLYTIFAVVLTLCLGGISFFALVAIILDICFVGCFVAIAVLTRGGAHSCSGIVNTPIGNGPADSTAAGYGKNGFGFGSNENVTYLPNLSRACKLETAVFAVAIVNVILFLISAAVQVLLARHHKREKRYGPSPSNNYTSGAGRRPFWRRNRNKNHVARDAEVGAVGAGAIAAEKHHHNRHSGIRPSHDTEYTGSTMAPNEGYGGAKYSNEPMTGVTGGYAGHHEPMMGVSGGYAGQGYDRPAHGVTATNANF